jgi:hypothetical protein
MIRSKSSTSTVSSMVTIQQLCLGGSLVAGKTHLKTLDTVPQLGNDYGKYIPVRLIIHT